MGWIRRLRGTLMQSDVDFDAERQFHLDERTDEFMRGGMSREEARRAAIARFGNQTIARERVRDVDTFPWLDDVRRDAAYAIRMLRRSRGFALLAIGCLAFGIAGTAAVFSWIEGILLRPYPLVVEQERLLAVTGTNRGSPGHTGVSWPDWLDLQRRATSFDAFIAEKVTGTTLSVGDRAERAPGSMVSANYFDAIGVHPVVGRAFVPGEDVGRNAHPVTVISYQMWKDRFRADPAIVGKTQMLNGLPHEIVGVAPEGFYGTFMGYAFQFWVPISMQARFDAGAYKLEDRGARWIEGFVRPKRGVTLEQAQAELSAIAARLEAEYPETNRGYGIRLWPLWQTPFNGSSTMQPMLAVALAVVVAVLLIACANVGNLLMLRAFARRQELTVRLSIGAGRSRLVRQLLTEGLVLTAIAGTGGVAAATWMRDAVALLLPPRGGIVLRFPGAIDWRVLSASVAVCVMSTLLFALVPAVLMSNIDVASALRSESGSVVASRRQAWVRSTLVLVQIALSFVLLVGAGLIIRSLHAIRTASPGFSTRSVLLTSVDLFVAGYDTQRAKQFQDQLIDRVRQLPGVESAAFSRTAPFSYRTYSSAAIEVNGYDAPLDQQPVVEYNEIGPGFLATIGVPLVAGREFTRADDERAPLAAVVDETMAAQFWRGADPVGRRMRVNGDWMQVIGVARNAKYQNLLEPPKPFFYVALRQNFSPTTALQIRTAQSPAALAPPLVREVRSLDSSVAPFELIAMREQVERTMDAQRISGSVLLVFGALALAMAGIGLYGVMAALVSQRSRELALRMALGAGSYQLMHLVLSRGFALAAGGIAAGLVLALQATRLLGYLLYGVSPREPSAFLQAALIVAAAAFGACVVPVWNAIRTDPIRALRG